MSRKSATVLLALALLSPAPLLHGQTPRGSEIPVNQRHKGHQFLPQVAVAPSGGFVVVWLTGQPNFEGPSQAWFRLFAADGRPRIPEHRVSDLRGEKEGFPAVAMGPDGGFVVVWHSGSERDSKIYGRRFDAAGQPLTGAFRLSDAEVGSQYDPAVDVAGDGSFVAVWLSGAAPRDERADVLFRRFDAAGQPLGPEEPVDPTMAGAKAREPRVAVDEGGGFAVGWLGSDDEAPPHNLLFRRFAAGVTPPPTVQVNPGSLATVSPLYDMDVAESGLTVFVWTAFDADTISPEFSVGILGRIFAADGRAVASIFHVNVFEEHSQHRPTVSFGANAGFLVAWRSASSPRTGNAIYARRFIADGRPRGGEIEIARSRHVGFDYPAVALNAAGRGAIAWASIKFDFEVVAKRLAQVIP